MFKFLHLIKYSSTITIFVKKHKYSLIFLALLEEFFNTKQKHVVYLVNDSIIMS